MATIGELVDQGDIPEERKDSVKKVLHDLGYAGSRAAGLAFMAITKKDMTDAGMCIADANAMMVQVMPFPGDLLKALWHSLLVDPDKPLNRGRWLFTCTVLAST